MVAWTWKAASAFERAWSMRRGWKRRVYFQDAIAELSREGELSLREAEELMDHGNEVL